jgi:hypothetical protein
MDFSKYYKNQVDGLNGFSGLRVQRGHGLGSMFKKVFKFALPIIQRYAEPVLKNALKYGVSEISSGMSKLNKDINEDNMDIKESASKRFKETVTNIKNKLQTGQGKKKTRKNLIKQTSKKSSIKAMAKSLKKSPVSNSKKFKNKKKTINFNKIKKDKCRSIFD